VKHPVGVYLVLGRRGMGKTHFMRTFVEELRADGRDLVLIHDRRGQFPGKLWRSIGDFRSAERVSPVNVFVADEPAAVAALAVELAERKVRVALVIDELDMVCSPARFFDEPSRARGSLERQRHGNLYNICHLGRHFGRGPGEMRDDIGVTLVGSARRPQNLQTDLGELAERIVLFRSNGRNALTWIAETCGEAIAAEVARLPARKWVVYDPADISDVSPGKRATEIPAHRR
jgi:Cdc6-like AAA superfamily ATPase